MYQHYTVAAVIPAYNEEDAIALVVDDLQSLSNDKNTALIDEIIVCDNASTDLTAIQAKQSGARVVYEASPGYGAACKKGLSAVSRADIIVFIDGDYSFIASQVERLLYEISKGADLVIGSRVIGDIQKGALTLPQRVGNYCASWLIHYLWKQPVSDLGPFRAITWSALGIINMQDKAYGWTVEMQVKAICYGMQITEVPVDTQCRIGHSKISGTIKGVVGAAVGIFSTIFLLWWQQRFILKPQKST